MSTDTNDGGAAAGGVYANLTSMRIVLILLFGGLLMGLLGTVTRGGSRFQPPRKRRLLLTVEEAVRLRM